MRRIVRRAVVVGTLATAGAGLALLFSSGARATVLDVYLLVIGAVVLLALIVWRAFAARRRKRLQERFGSEYERTIADAPSRRQAESDLAEREKRREELNIRPLEQSSRDRYASRWHNTQAQFVDDPESAVGEADALIQEVMRERG